MHAFAPLEGILPDTPPGYAVLTRQESTAGLYAKKSDDLLPFAE